MSNESNYVKVPAMPAEGSPVGLQLSLLGSFKLDVSGKPVRLPTRKAEGLLAYLVLHRGVQNRERLAALFWGDSTDELARRSLRTALSALRKELGDDLVIADRETIQLNPAVSMWVDVYELEKQIEKMSNIDPDIYRGDLLIDFYDEWVLEEREHYRSVFINTLQKNIQTLKTNGEYQRAIALAEKIISIDSVNEQAYQQLIFCQHTLGNRSAALKSYAECRRQLGEQLGVEPSEDTAALYKRVRESTTSNTQFVRSNLPIPLTSFIGREQELKTLSEIFTATRLLTLTGVGGCGKTRLSIQFAAHITDEFFDGVWWLELASIQDEKLLAQTVKRALGVADSQSDSAEESLFKFLRAKNILLVMDNCEHIITACAALVQNILSRCPGVKILATSREALSIHGEIAWLVPSLSLPPNDQTGSLLQWESLRLFFERASLFRSDLQLTESDSQSLLWICRALEGIPLAIELAAARVKTLSIEQLAARLDDKLALLTTGSRTAQPRQQTLRATIDWSYELLSEQEQTVLQRLAIFYGTWTLDAAEFVCADEVITASKILDFITRLLDKSLLVSENKDDAIRYRMLEIVRQYALEKLEQQGSRQQVQDRHTRYYSELAQHVRAAWFTLKQGPLIKQFDADYPNLRVALAWGLADSRRSENWKYGVRLTVALGPLWNFLGEYNEGQGWQKKAIAGINAVLGESDSKSVLSEAEVSSERGGLLSIKGWALYEYGFLVWFQSRYVEARTIFLEASAIFTEIQDAVGRAYSDMFLAQSTWALGQREEARKLWAGSLHQLEQIGDDWGMGMVHSFLGRAEREADNYVQAKREYGECLRLFGAVGDDWGLGISLSHLGMVEFQNNNALKARELFEQRLALSRKSGFKQSAAYSIFLLGMVSWKLNDAKQVQYYLREAMPFFHQAGNSATRGECLLGLAWAEMSIGSAEQAAYILGVTEKADETAEIRMNFEEVYFHKPVLEELQTRLGDEKYLAARARGRDADMDEVVKSVLGG